jgi:hypothetical protein
VCAQPHAQPYAAFALALSYRFEQYRASSSSTLRVETTTTDQSEGAPTSFDDLFRKLFRRARIL